MASSTSSPGDPDPHQDRPLRAGSQQVARARPVAPARRRHRAAPHPHPCAGRLRQDQPARAVASRCSRSAASRVAWLTLEEEESDAQRFAEYLMAAIAGGPGAARACRCAPRFPPSSTGCRGRARHRADPGRLPSRRKRERLHLHAQPDPPRPAHPAHRDRLARLPEARPGALAAKEDLFEIGVERSQVHARRKRRRLLNRGAAAPLADDEIAKLVKRTEGWPIALQMTALSLRKGCDRAELIANFSGPAWELAQLSFGAGARQPAAGHREHRHAHGRSWIA